ncbi:MAG: hypothetical protein NTZ03_15505 [Actinobacteria bacterium]|nr:hypothetical protein [Actinomycetota bacterium]
MARAHISDPSTMEEQPSPADPFVVVCFPEGSTESLTIDFSDWVGSSALRAEMAVACRRLTGPAGGWRSVHTINGGVAIGRRFVSWCDDRGLQTFANLTPSLWNDWLLHVQSKPSKAGTQRDLIARARHFVLASGVASENVVDVLKHRLPRGPIDEVECYSEEQFNAIQSAAKRVVAAAHRRITENIALCNNDPSLLTVEQQTRVTALRILAKGETLARIDHYRALSCVATSYPPSLRGGAFYYGQHVEARSQMFLMPSEATNTPLRGQFLMRQRPLLRGHL